MKKPVYLDYAAATPVDEAVLKAMQPFFTKQFYNPSALYLSSRSVRNALSEVRDLVAEQLAVRGSEIIFTAGGTEANNLAIRGIMSKHPGKKLLISSVEHESVRTTAKLYNTQEIKVDAVGLLDKSDLQKKLKDDTVLVSVIYASNEVGTIQDIKGIAKIISEVKLDRKKRGVKSPLYLHTDATQAASFLNISPNSLGVDFMTLNGGKIYGPKQSGALFVRSGIDLEPIIYGGGQEKTLRSGTENVAGIVGFAHALKISRSMAKSESARLTILRCELRCELEKLSGKIIFHGHPEKRLPNHLSFAIPGHENERLMMELDELGFMIATGSACSAAKVEVSHVLNAIGVNTKIASSTLRVTLGRETTQADIKRFVEALASCLKRK